MNAINEKFEEEEFKKIKTLKKQSDLNWHDFIILLVDHAKEAIKKGDLAFID